MGNCMYLDDSTSENTGDNYTVCMHDSSVKKIFCFIKDF